MGERPTGVTDVASGAGVADFRTRERSVGGSTSAEQYLILQRERVLSYIGIAATFRQVAIVLQSTIHNAAGSAVLVAVRDAIVTEDNTGGASTSTYPTTVHEQAAIPTGGTDLTKGRVGTGSDAVETSSASVVVKGGVASDGGASTAITLTLGDRLRSVMAASRTASQVNQIRTNVLEAAFPETWNLLDTPIILRAGESLAANAEAAATVRSRTVTWVWEEYTLP